MGFESCHPAVNFLFFAAVIYGSVAFQHPVFLAISCLCAFAFSMKRNGKRAVIFNLCLLPLVVGITYEFNRWVGRHVQDSKLAQFLTAPGLWMQNFTTNEPDDSMIEVGIAAVQAVLPEKEGSDRW